MKNRSRLVTLLLCLSATMFVYSADTTSTAGSESENDASETAQLHTDRSLPPSKWERLTTACSRMVEISGNTRAQWGALLFMTGTINALAANFCQHPVCPPESDDTLQLLECLSSSFHSVGWKFLLPAGTALIASAKIPDYLEWWNMQEHSKDQPHKGK